MYFDKPRHHDDYPLGFEMTHLFLQCLSTVLVACTMLVLIDKGRSYLLANWSIKCLYHSHSICNFLYLLSSAVLATPDLRKLGLAKIWTRGIACCLGMKLPGWFESVPRLLQFVHPLPLACTFALQAFLPCFWHLVRNPLPSTCTLAFQSLLPNFSHSSLYLRCSC